MEVIMNEEVKSLIEKANKIISKTGNKPGTKYPKSLKEIVITLRNEYHLSVQEVTKYIAISEFSAREWPRAKKSSFNKISLNNVKTPKIVSPANNYKNEVKEVISSLKGLKVLISFLIFQSLIFHLISLRS
jgi:hypothetical protein